MKHIDVKAVFRKLLQEYSESITKFSKQTGVDENVIRSNIHENYIPLSKFIKSNVRMVIDNAKVENQFREDVLMLNCWLAVKRLKKIREELTVLIDNNSVVSVSLLDEMMDLKSEMFHAIDNITSIVVLHPKSISAKYGDE